MFLSILVESILRFLELQEGPPFIFNKGAKYKEIEKNIAACESGFEGQ